MSDENVPTDDAVDAATDESDSGIRVDILRGDPSPEELAAVVAVVTEAYAHEAAAAIADPEARASAWQVSARAPRAPLRREVGWGRFAG